jgi:hypothetical protein
MATNVKGADHILAKLKAIEKSVPKIVLQSVNLEANLVMTDSKKNYVPVDTGTLRSSGQVTVEDRNGIITANLSYGGAASPYALAVHEHPSTSSPRSWKRADKVNFHPANRGPKYLERPLFAALKGMDDRLAERIKKRIDELAAKATGVSE